ncbi:MAG: DNA internalization-related competence protein ComEC/Rec2 [Candidatus Binatia bacterium]
MLVPFALAFLAGGISRPGAIGPAVLVVLAAVAVTQCRSTPLRARASAAAAGLALAALLVACTHVPPPANDVTRLVGPGTTAIEGRVVRSETNGERAALMLAVDRVRRRGTTAEASGLVGLTVAHARRSWAVGTRLRAVGRLRRPRLFGNPGEYDFVATLARRGVRATMFLWDDEHIEGLSAPSDRPTTRIVEGIRAAMSERIAAHAAEPARGYLVAVLLGDMQSLDRAIRTALTRTGLTHVVSVSGFHIAVAAGASIVAIRWLLVRIAGLPLRIDVTIVAALAGTLPVGLYAALAGGSVPAARSFLSYGVLLGALLCARPPDALRALAAAAVLLAVATPDLAADVSFELSFLSVLALILLARQRPVVAAEASRWRRYVVDPVRVSVAATIVTAPLTAWHFQQVSLIAPLANLVALPLLGPATLLPGLAAIPLVGLVPPLADLLLGVAAHAADLGLRIACTLGALSWAAVDTPTPSLLEIALGYGFLAALWFRPPRTPVALALLAVVTVGDVGYWTWQRFGDPTLRVTFLSVGQGDAAVVEAPGGAVLVVDGGGFTGDFDPGERLIAPFLHARKILRVDALALSHPQLDHYGGLAYLAEHFAPRQHWSNGTRATAAGFARLERALDDAGTDRVMLKAGARRSLGPDVVVEVVHPTATEGLDPNEASLVFRLRFGTTAMLFTGDVEHGAERAMLGSTTALASDVLKVPHHGSATSTTPGWLAAVAPRIAVVSSGHDNRFGFPAPAVVRRLRAGGASVWSTAEQGAIRVVSDGRRIEVAALGAPIRPMRFVFPTSLW